MTISVIHSSFIFSFDNGIENSYSVPSAVPKALQILTHLNLVTSRDYYAQLADEKTELQRGQVTCSRAHSAPSNLAPESVFISTMFC